MVSSMGGNIGDDNVNLLPWKLDLATPEMVKLCRCVGVWNV